MSELATVNVEEQARTLVGILREYADKLMAANKELFAVLAEKDDGFLDESRAAWLLDRSEVLRKPLLRLVSRGHGLHDHSGLDALTRDELALRLTEVDLHLHHMVRQTGQLRSVAERYKLAEDIARLRMAAGLNAMKGGPLRPDE